MLKVGGSTRWKEKGKEEEEIGFEWKIRWRGKRGSGGDERREERERAGLWGDGALSDAGLDHLDESGARSLTVNTGLHFHMEKDQGKRFKHPFSTFLPAIHPKPRLRQLSSPRVGGKRYQTSLLASSSFTAHNIQLPTAFFSTTHTHPCFRTNLLILLPVCVSSLWLSFRIPTLQTSRVIWGCSATRIKQA